MRTHDKHIWNPFWQMLTSAGSALPVLVFLAACTQMAQPAPPSSPAKAYVGLFKDNAVAVLDTGANRVLSTITIPPGPHGLVVTPDGRKVYVSSDGASTVSVINTASDRVVGSIEVGPTPHGLAISPDGRQVLVAGFGTNQAVIIDTATDRVVGRVPVLQPHNSAISPDGHTAYVASQQQGAMALVILNIANRTLVGRVPLDKTPRALSISPDGTRLYFTVAGADAVQVLDTASNRIAGQVPVGASPHHPLFTPNGQFGLVVSQGPGELGILHPTDNTVTGTVRVGQAPHWIAASSDGRTAYVTNEGSNDVSVVDLASRTVTATIPVGSTPRKIAVQPRPVANVSVLSPAQAAAPSGGASRGQATAQGAPQISDHGTKDVKGQTEVDLEADDYYFAPTFLRGTPGQKLTLEVENESGTLHNLSIPDQQIDKDIPPKGKVNVEVTFPPSGVVRFFCKFHRSLGMNGALLSGNGMSELHPHGTPAKADAASAH